jgi:predicted TIM-barrel fold metal-dependent hydrolase
MADGEIRLRFTPGAARVVQYAKEEARRYRGEAIGPEHLLLGLMREQGGLPARALGDLGVTPPRVQNAVRRQADLAGAAHNHEPTSHWSREAQHVLELALEEARETSPDPGPAKIIGCAHLLLALVREGDSAVAQLLRDLGASPEQVRREVLRLQADGEGPLAPAPAPTRPAKPSVPRAKPAAPHAAPAVTPRQPIAAKAEMTAVQAESAAPRAEPVAAPPKPPAVEVESVAAPSEAVSRQPEPAAAEAPSEPPRRLVDINACFGYDPHTGVTTTPEAVKRAGQRWEVAGAYLLSRHAALCDLQEGNAQTLEVCRKDPFFRPVAVLSPTAYRALPAVGQARRQGFAFARLFPDLHSFSVDGQACRDLLIACGVVGLPVMIPTLAAGPANLLRALDGVRGTFLLTHNHYSVLGEVLALAGRLPGLYLDISGVNTPDGIALLAHAFGADHLLFGSGYPSLQVGCAALLLQGSGLSEAQLEAVAYRNAERLLGVKP